MRPLERVPSSRLRGTQAVAKVRQGGVIIMQKHVLI
jgi:hypothetical protein